MVTDKIHQDRTIIGVANLENGNDITTLACHDSGEYIFCGKDNGSVALYSAETGTEIKILYNHGKGIMVTYLAYQKDSDVIASGDAANRLLVWRIIIKDHLTVEGPLLDVHIANSHSIRQLVLDTTNERILVSTNTSDTVYDIGSGQHESSTFPERLPWKWIAHPCDSTKLIHITTQALYICSWDDLSKLSFKMDLTLDMDMNVEMLVRNVTACSYGSKLTVEYASASSLKSASHTLILELKDLEEPFASMPGLPSAFVKISSKIRYIIGSLGGKLLFLDQQMWVCSLDLENFKGEYSRHFFIPDDWLSVNRGMILKVTSKSDLVFVKKDEVAIIKGGLIYNEVVLV